MILMVSIDQNKSLAYLYPDLNREWSIRNSFHPIQVTSRSHKRVWWQCKLGHEWIASIANRTSLNQNCPYCSNKKASATNNLGYLYPEVANQWNKDKNLDLSPNQVTYGSSKKIWWICSKGHEWKTSIKHRTINKSGCPYCSNKRANEINNLTVNFSYLLKEWDYEKNVGLIPDEVSYGSEKQVWWKCEKGHSWRSVVKNRSNNNTGCPHCCFTHTNLEKFVEEKLGIQKFNKFVLGYKPDFQLSDTLFLNVDGLYWHSEMHREKDYHFKLREAFESEGKRILQFYEDEIYNKWNIVKSIIDNSLGNSSIKINARECIIKKVFNNESKEFLEQNHLMGSYSFANNFGMYYKDELVSLISIRLVNEVIEISRFASKIGYLVRGGFGKLVQYIIKQFKSDKIISFCDLRYSLGSSYKKMNFIKTGVSLGWCWSDNKSRFNRLYCKAGNGKTERENALEYNLFRIYDAGQAKYELGFGV